MNFAVGIGYLLIGMITFVKQPTEKNRWIFLILCIIVFTIEVEATDLPIFEQILCISLNWLFPISRT